MQNKKLKVLLITSMPWRNDNNIGNSYSNIFKGLEEEIEFAHLYCRAGMPHNDICHKYYQLDESKLVSNILKKTQLGNEFYLSNPMDTPKETYSASYNKMRVLRWEVLFLARNVLWSMSKWKTETLDKFICEFKPDLIFATLTYMPNINKLLVYFNDLYKIPLFIYSWDDVYFNKKQTLSPIYWFRRNNQRYWIRQTMSRAHKLYAISEKMREEYSDYFSVKCDILRKGYHFDKQPVVKTIINENIKMVYAGNIGDNRWTVLAKIAEALKVCNSRFMDKHMVLDVYTLSPVTKEMEESLNVEDSCSLKGALSPEEIDNVLDSADILVHVESFDEDNLNKNRLSFSTKIVDCLYKAKCILAVGGKNASMDYLSDNDAAIVVNDVNAIENTIMRIMNNPNIIYEYGDKSWKCGCVNHDIASIQKMLLKDFEEKLVSDK